MLYQVIVATTLRTWMVMEAETEAEAAEKARNVPAYVGNIANWHNPEADPTAVRVVNVVEVPNGIHLPPAQTIEETAACYQLPDNVVPFPMGKGESNDAN